MRWPPAAHRSLAAPLAAVAAALVVYAGLYPFVGWRWPPGQPLSALLWLPWPPWRDVFDAWANALGYLPLGALTMLAARRRGLSVVVSMLLTLALAFALSYITEVLQHFLPQRHPSLKDVAANVGGSAVGAALAQAAYALGLVERWSGLRRRWFQRDQPGALVLLALWPAALLFPAPVPFGLGQVAGPLRETVASVLEGVTWAASLQAWIAPSAAPPPALSPAAEALTSTLGLLAPCLLAYSVAVPGWRRLALALGAVLVAVATLTLATMLNFGPRHAWAWLTPAAPWALGLALVLAAVLAIVTSRLAAALGLMVLTALVMLVAQAPEDPFFASTLMAWEEGRWVRLHGLSQWLTWLWPYAAMAWLLGRLAQRG